MQNITNIVYLMLENRSLDNVLGWLYATNNSPANFIPAADTSSFNGLTPDMSNPDPNTNDPVYVSMITVADGQTIPSVDPNEDFQHVQVQIAGNMSGFYSDFLSAGSSNPPEIMACYTPESLPVLNSLALNFAVSDAYFSSIPTQTNCNRAFSLTGNSIGSYDDWPNENNRTAMVNNYWEKNIDDMGDPYEFTQPTIWNVLNNNGYASQNDWMIYYNQTWPGVAPYEGSYCFTEDLLYPSLQGLPNFAPYSTFLSQAAAGTLPTFSYLEPAWYETVHNGSDYHPPANVSGGEQFLYQLYQALQASPNWAGTLLIINFDEHGGTFDHVEPPTGVLAPWANAADGTAPPDDYDIEFSYTQLGVRVPLILVSPLIQGQTIIRSNTNTPFDHTSVIATILNQFNIPKDSWGLGSRTANAPTFEDVITLAPQYARTNIQIAEPLSTGNVNPEETPPSDLQWMLAHRMFSRIVRKHNLSRTKFNELYNQHFSTKIKTMKELNEKIGIVLAELSK